ncbi:MAG: VWA domain-containing protein, partial [Ignavibacteriae bacterium]|nr:VWA domain-containing protein [Ignavibacteriota bacterium]
FHFFVKVGIAQPELTAVDYAFLVDVSGSMAGQKGHTNIFPTVQSALQQFVRSLEVGSTVFFFPFDDRIREMKEFSIQSEANKKHIENYIRSLRADGNNTAIYNTIHASLERINEYRKHKSGEHTVIFFVYTDGDDNVSKEWNLESILGHFNLKRGEHDWLFYTELGLPSDAHKVKIFKSQPHVIYVQERRGDVHPIIHIETLIPVLNFGNLKSSLRSTRVEKFEIRGEKPPPEYAVTVESVFEDLKSQGVFAQVTPKSFFPSESVELELLLVNAEGISDGIYRGILKLRSSDPLVVIAPNEISASFSYQIDPQIEILPATGEEFPLNMGEVNIHSDIASSREIKKAIFVQFNSTAERSGEKLKVTLIQDPSVDNPLELGKHLVVDPIQGTEGWIGPDTKQLQLIFRGNPDLSSGTYQGKILFGSDKLTVVGKGIETKESSPSVHSLSWIVKIPKKPSPWWVWLVIPIVLGAIGFLLVRKKLQPPVLTDLKLDVREPETKVIDLSGRSEVKFGKDGEHFQDHDVSFFIRAKREGRKVYAVLHVQDGQVLLKKSDEQDDTTLIGEEKIFDGDIVKFENNKVLVSSYSFTRE